MQLLTDEQVDELGSACARADAIGIADPSQRIEMAYWVGGDRAAGTGMDIDVIPAHAPSGAVPGRGFARTGTLDSIATEGVAAYLMLFGSGDEPADWLRAGEALSAGWLAATRLGLSVLPFSSVIEVTAVRESLRRDILAGLGYPYLVVRLGVPDPITAWLRVRRGCLPNRPLLSTARTLKQMDHTDAGDGGDRRGHQNAGERSDEDHEPGRLARMPERWRDGEEGGEPGQRGAGGDADPPSCAGTR